MTPYYEDGTCTIYHGDALEILPELQSSSVGIVLTDPHTSIDSFTGRAQCGLAAIGGHFLS